MNMLRNRHCVSFVGSKLIAEGDLLDVALTSKKAIDSGSSEPLLIFDEESQLVEIDFRGSADAVEARIRQGQNESPAASVRTAEADALDEKLKPGRPKLGVVAREVTLLPRHWDWLNAQPGGASVTLRKLVDGARKENVGGESIKKQQEIAYRFMTAMAGNETGFELAIRALFKNDAENFNLATKSWPTDVASHAKKLTKDLFQN